MVSTAVPTALMGSVIIAAVVFTVAVAKLATAQLEHRSVTERKRLNLVIVLMSD
jgi:hypothetical protein